MIRKKQFVIVLVIAFILVASNVFADYIERECTLIAEKFDRICRQSFPETQPTIAIIPFTSRMTDLQQRNIGFGVSELLTSSIVNKKTFTVLERSQIEKVLGEQKLSLTGLTADSALKVGELVGAKLIVTGTVDKIGENYRINCRLVSAENGTVLASHIADFRIDEFEKKAKNYIIPKKEAIGVYAGWRIIPVTPLVTNSSVKTGDFTYSNARGLSNMLSSICVGSRFYIVDNLVVDLSYMVPHFEYSVNMSGSGSQTMQHNENSGYSDLALTVSWVLPLNPRMDVFLGAGIEYSREVFPLVTACFEWRPWQNIGVALWVYYRFGTDIISLCETGGNSIPPMPIFQIDPLSIMPVVSFYF
ncbi:hypothetical protein COS91_05705 [Candidatus Desantisbacteria bacterium CG07_land_8_20_14_0_80_39_15]|uniref:FlgO domain-containing protein n=2 Tax=unclassified Candidatus Desantisiibacteriota TaxID=3106372 RepID=A0A2H9P9B0_9BACT|nr:MAG: hypothetical protein COS91_05705 [Candidatus Desantisbacteria bacterium CG07_land_8_20_14_0_80_39_15]PIZ14810.1 MAG: hypothetical protein COY51_07265 [Candidatus Desantisbacteria bacterium CG_4_10_14_0_8_um_filter_39_17]